MEAAVPLKVENLDLEIDHGRVLVHGTRGPLDVLVPKNPELQDMILRTRFEDALRKDPRTVIGRHAPAKP